jgi:hypothetical protein
LTNTTHHLGTQKSSKGRTTRKTQNKDAKGREEKENQIDTT